MQAASFEARSLLCLKGQLCGDVAADKHKHLSSQGLKGVIAGGVIGIIAVAALALLLKDLHGARRRVSICLDTAAWQSDAAGHTYLFPDMQPAKLVHLGKAVHRLKCMCSCVLKAIGRCRAGSMYELCLHVAAAAVQSTNICSAGT